MTRPRPIVLVALLAAAAVCVPVFFAAHIAASVLLYRLADVRGLSPAGAAGVSFLTQFAIMLVAMGMTYATFAGLRWVWQGTNLSRK